MASQNILNIVDTAMVGSLGDEALAAVGLGGFIIFMCQALVIGISAGVQAMTSRRKGEGKEAETAIPLNAGIVISFLLGLPLSVGLYLLAPQIFSLTSDDLQVIDHGVPYIEARLLALIAVGINFSFRGFWNGMHMTSFYLRSILIMHTCNIILNYLLIFGHFGFPKLGVQGSGLATAISLYIGSIYYFYAGMKQCKQFGFLGKWPSIAVLKTVFRISIPNGFQMLFFAAGFTTLYWIIGKIGTQELAAANVIINISMTCILPAIAFGLSAASLVGQSLGRNNAAEASQWGWDVVKVAFATLGILGLPMLILPETLLTFFIHNESTVQLGIAPLRIAGGFMAIESIGLVLLNAQLGAGDSRRILVVSTVIQWLFFLPLAYTIGPILGFGLTAVWICQGIYRSLLSLTMAFMWHRKSWAKIQV
jgi:putative MATE family efflux protein